MTDQEFLLELVTTMTCFMAALALRKNPRASAAEIEVLHPETGIPMNEAQQQWVRHVTGEAMNCLRGCPPAKLDEYIQVYAQDLRAMGYDFELGKVQEPS